MAIGAGNTMLIAAVIPPLTRTLGLPDWMAGAIFSLSALCWSLSSPFWGKRSNRYGRRRIAAMGLAGYSLSMFLLLMASWAAISELVTAPLAIFACLALSRTVFGLVGSGSSPAAQAYVADRTTPSERQGEIAFVTSGFSFGTVVGPAFAAVLVANFGLLSPMLITCLMAGIMAVLLWKFLPENRAPVEDATKIEAVPGAIGLWRSRNVLPFLAYAVTLSLVTGILTQVFVFAVIEVAQQNPDDHRLYPALDWRAHLDPGAGFPDPHPCAILPWHRAGADAARLFQRRIAGGLAAAPGQCGRVSDLSQWDGLYHHAALRPVPVRICRSVIAVLDLRGSAHRYGAVRLARNCTRRWRGG